MKESTKRIIRTSAGVIAVIATEAVLDIKHALTPREKQNPERIKAKIAGKRVRLALGLTLNPNKLEKQINQLEQAKRR